MDTLSTEARSHRMGLIRSKDSAPEMLVRRAVHALGFRFRLHRKDLPGKPDLVFVSRRKVIFVHGCFWHRHPDPACKLARLPKSRLDFWLPKLEANRRRDVLKEEQLIASGWEVVTIWECQTKNMPLLKTTIETFLTNAVD